MKNTSKKAIIKNFWVHQHDLESLTHPLEDKFPGNSQISLKDFSLDDVEIGQKTPIG